MIPGWEKFQHYGNREATWIKNYVELLDRDEYMALTPTAVAMLHRLWLLYARRRGVLRRSLMTHAVTGVVARPSHWQELEMQGFITFSASKPLALPRAHARARAGEEVEEELRTPQTPHRRGGPKPVDKQPTSKNSKGDVHELLLEAATQLAAGWNGHDSTTFDTQLEQLEHTHMSRLTSLERDLLWTLAFQPDRTDDGELDW